MKVKEYTNQNDNVTILWKPELCYHSKNCVNNLPSVFDNEKRPWINPDGASGEDIIKVVGKCPSGALSIKADDDSNSANTEVSIAKNGPYIITGDFKVIDPEGTEIEVKGKAALCRCGDSSNKPFCDGSHVMTGFEG